VDLLQNADAIVSDLRSRANERDRTGMARFGIRADNVLGGTSLPELRRMAKAAGIDHRLAADLWRSGIHEARILASMVDDPARVTERQMESWARDFDTWDVVDCTCATLFDRTPFAYDKAFAWSEREEEFVKRAGFVLMAALAVHDKQATDEQLAEFLPVIVREAGDPRNFVRKAVNWALRQIGKRNLALNADAIRTSEQILAEGPRSARWVASDALRELRSDAVQARLTKRAASAGARPRSARAPASAPRASGASPGRTPGRSSSRTDRKGSGSSR
jgi:3-methyladenine DNA glycosylase AlkD